MLVLTRKKEEKLTIGDNITLTILKVKGNSVQIGIEAPKSVRVLRSELAFDLPKCDDDADSNLPASKPERTGGGVNRLRQLADKVSHDRAVVASAVQLV